MYLKFILTGIVIILTIDIYYYRAIKESVKKLPSGVKKVLKISYWFFTLLSISFMFFAASFFIDQTPPPKFARTYIMGVLLIVALSKLIGSIFLIIHDIIKSISWLIKKSFKPKTASNINSISRIEFLKKTALIASIIPFSTLMFGVLKSAFVTSFVTLTYLLIDTIYLKTSLCDIGPRKI